MSKKKDKKKAPTVTDAPPPTGPTVTAAEAAELLGKSRRTIGRMLNAGRLPGAVLTDQGWRIPRDALDATEPPTEPVPPPTEPENGPRYGGPLSSDTADRLADLEAELADWRRRAEVAEAVAAERADALADARASLALAQRLAALNLVENAPYRDAQEITEQAEPAPDRPTSARQWISRRWRKQ